MVTPDQNRPKFVMVSGDVKAASLERIRYFRDFDVYQLFQRTRVRLKADDTASGDYGNRNIQCPTPWNLYSVLCSLEPDVVQGPEPFSLLMLSFLVAVYLYLLRHPRTQLVVVSFEPIPLREKYTPLAVPLFSLVLMPYFARARAFFGLIPGVRENLLDFGAPEEKLVYEMYGDWGVDLDFWTADGPAVDFPWEKPTVLFVGRLAVEKGVSYLLEGFRIVRERGIDAGLAIVGDGPERVKLERLAMRSGCGADIKFFGLVKNRDLPPYYRGAAVVVHPTVRTRLLWEQWGYVGMQALACGKPLIISDTPQMREMAATSATIFVPEKDPGAIADALQQVLQDESRRRSMSVEARAYAERRFDEPHNVAVTERTLLTVCGFDGNVQPLVPRGEVE